MRPRIDGTTNIIPPTEIATNMHVNFNYQVDPDGNLRQEQSFAVLSLEEYRLGALDFAIVRLAGNPGLTFCMTEISPTDAGAGDMVAIIQHPEGLPKRIEAGEVLAPTGSQIRYSTIDTLGGSSGSGILASPGGRIVGVHTNGGCDEPNPGHNRGVRITSIIEASPLIQGILERIEFREGWLTFGPASGGRSSTRCFKVA